MTDDEIEALIARALFRQHMPHLLRARWKPNPWILLLVIVAAQSLTMMVYNFVVS